MQQQLHFHLSLLLLTLLFSTALSDSLAPLGSANITDILEKAGQYTMLVRLLKTTQTDDQINNQISSSTQGFTLFAPTDDAFSVLKLGALNSLTDEQKFQLMQFHILPSFVSFSQFKTMSNPLHTEAGNSDNGKFPLNVTTSGNDVHISTGVVNATVAKTIYTDGQLAVYQVDQVLVPLSIGPGLKLSPSSTPKSSSTTTEPASVETSDARSLTRQTVVSFGVVVIVAFFSL